MFIRHSVHIGKPVASCTEVLMSGPKKWFPRLGSKSVGTVGMHVAGIPVHKRVTVELGEPVKTSTWTVIPLNWKATFEIHVKPVNGTGEETRIFESDRPASPVDWSRDGRFLSVELLSRNNPTKAEPGEKA